MKKGSTIIITIMGIMIICLLYSVIKLHIEFNNVKEYSELQKSLLTELIYLDGEYSLEYKNFDNKEDDIKSHEVKLEMMMPSILEKFVDLQRIPTNEFFNIIDNKTKFVLFENNKEEEIYFADWISREYNLESGEKIIKIEYALCDSDKNNIKDSMFVKCNDKILFLEGIQRRGDYYPAVNVSNENIESIYLDETIEINTGKDLSKYKGIVYGISENGYFDNENNMYVDDKYSFEVVDKEKPSEDTEKVKFVFYKNLVY